MKIRQGSTQQISHYFHEHRLGKSSSGVNGSRNFKLLFSCLLGNALEFYDFTLCGVFIISLSQTFFPPSGDSTSLLGGIFVFSAAFWTRPLGAIVFGYIGDKWGRKNALSISIMLMGIPSFVIGILPGYEVLGIIAPITLLICRLLQGFCAGGEYNGAAVFALEHFQVKQGVISGLISASCVAGALAAAMVGYLLSKPGYDPEAWRWAFLAGALISFIGYFIRRYTQETQKFLTEKKIEKFPLFYIWQNHRISFLISIMTGALNGILSYTLFGFLNIYLMQYIGIEATSAFFYNIFGLLAFLVFCPLFGFIADKTHVTFAMKMSACLIAVFSWVTFILLNNADSPLFICLGQLLLGVLVGSYAGPCHVFLQGLFPIKVRYSGVASGFSIGMAITGGSTAFVMLFILNKTNLLLIPAAYVCVSAIIWLLTLKLLTARKA